MKKPISRFYLLLVLVPLLLLASMGGYYFLEETAAGSDVVVVPQTPAPPSATPVPVPTPEPTPTPFPEHDITLMAVGDNLMHLGVVASGKQEDGTYDFGLLYCADFWKNKHPEVLVTGIHEDASQADDIPLLTIDDVTFAILNYTYGANTETLPLDLLGHLNLLCAVNEKNGQMDFTTLNPQVLEDISRAKELADIVIVCPHWGTEYSSKISSYQEKWALEMTEAGADVIIGTHPHVVEPVEWITAENGNESLCYYSLGNYVSTQKNALSMLEGMAWLTFHVAEDGVSIERKTTGVIPLVCQYTSGPVRFENVYLLEEYTEELAASHGIRNYAGVVLHLEDLQKWSDEILGDFVLTKDQALHNFKTDSINQ